MIIMGKLTVVVPHPETVTMVPAGGSKTSVVGGKTMGLAFVMFKSKLLSNYEKKTIHPSFKLPVAYM